jgi:hypothetical protein
VVLVRGKGHGLCFAISLSFIHLGVFGGVSSTGREEGSIALKKKIGAKFRESFLRRRLWFAVAANV